MRYCHCGATYKGKRCPECHKQHTQNYDWEHRLASEAYRREHPLCEACVMQDVLTANPSTSMHHIAKIVVRPDLRMVRANWLALCEPCHERLEDDVHAAEIVKSWSVVHYREEMSAEPIKGGVGL